MPFLALLGNKYVMYALMAVGLVVAVVVAKHQYDAHVLAMAQMADMQAAHAKQVEALEELAAAAQARAASSGKIKEQVHANKGTAVCGSDPAIRDLLDGMRQRAGTAGNAGKPAVVPTGAGAPTGH